MRITNLCKPGGGRARRPECARNGAKPFTACALRRWFALLGLLGLVGVAPASALKLQFPNSELRPTGAHSKGHVYVENDGESLTAIQISVVSRSHAADGTESNEKADKSFSVFPKQLLLEPGQEKLISIRWKGPSSVDQERAYRFVVQQLPIDLGVVMPNANGEGTQSVIRVISRIRKSFYVGPKSAKPDLIAESAKLVRGAAGGEALEIVLRNRGNAHEILRTLSLSLTPVDENGAPLGLAQSVDFDPKDWGGPDNVLAGEVRLFTLPWPENLPKGALAARLE